ncbi:MAG: hypothetical protein J0L97_07535 [Alphaproteobacteria bacterium]|nr:hypothetical protein [Alphaproteobacteria bacterium]
MKLPDFSAAANLKDTLLNSVKNAVPGSKPPAQPKDQEAQIEADLAKAASEVEKGADPESALSAVLEAYPVSMHAEIKKKFRLVLEEKSKKPQKWGKENQPKKAGLAGFFSEIAARITKRVRPQDLEAAKAAGKQLTEAGVSLKDMKSMGGYSLGELAPPAVGQEQTREQGVQQR